MKKQLFVFLLLVSLITTTAFAYFNPLLPDANNTVATEVATEEEEAIHCTVRVDGKIAAECWFCNCRKLYDSVMQHH